MRLRRLLPFWLLLVLSCSGLAPLAPVPEETAQQIRKDCVQVFPTGKWQLVHAIETLWPNRQSGTFIGVTILSSQSGRIDAIVSTFEGFTVFDASYDRQLRVRRAVPPFDSRALAQGLFEDIRLMFLKPRDPRPMVGRVGPNAEGCRYLTQDGKVVEIAFDPNGEWQIHQYSAAGRLLRTVTAKGLFSDKGPGGWSIPSRIELVGYEGVDYRLKLELLEAVKITESPGDAR